MQQNDVLQSMKWWNLSGKLIMDKEISMLTLLDIVVKRLIDIVNVYGKTF